MLLRTASLRLRLLLATLLVLPLFLVLTGFFLDRAFLNYQLQRQEEAMRLQHLLLVRVAEWVGRHWQMAGIHEPRLLLPNSGLYAFVFDPAGSPVWASPSARDVYASSTVLEPWLELAPTALGLTAFGRCGAVDEDFCFSQRLAWGSAGPEALFLVVENGGEVVAAQAAYRARLAAFAVSATLLLLLAQAMIFRWGLLPLGRIAATLAGMRRGEVDNLEDNYPAELRPLTENLQQLVDSERARRERVRSTMDRLAHVLRSPLMLIRNSADEGPAYRNLVEEQIERMLGVVEGELTRARLEGQQVDLLASPVAVKPILERIAVAYGRLPRPQGLEGESLTIDTRGVSEQAQFRGEERDLQDLFGSLLENAMKYARNRIEVSAKEQAMEGRFSLILEVSDDGPGIPEGLESNILERGARADTASAGYGVGLAIVIEIVSAYGGSLQAGASSMGGAVYRSVSRVFGLGKRRQGLCRHK